MKMKEKTEEKIDRKFSVNIGYKIRDSDGNVIAYIQVRDLLENEIDDEVKKKLIIKLFDDSVGVEIDETI